MKNLIAIFLFAFLVVGILSVATPVSALSSDIADDITGEVGVVGEKAFGESGGAGGLLTQRIGSIIKTILGLVGVVVVILIVYAGFRWMTAGGNKEHVTKAKDIMIQAVIGLAITLSAYAITDFVISRLIEASQS